MEIDSLKKHTKINQKIAYWVDKIKSAASFLPAFVYYTLHKLGRVVTAAVPIIFKCIYGSTYALLNLVRNVISLHQMIVYGKHMRHNKAKIKSTKNEDKLEIYKRSYSKNRKQFNTALVKFGLSGLAVGIGILTCIPGFNIAGIALMAVPFVIELAIDAKMRFKQHIRDRAYKGLVEKVLVDNKSSIINELLEVSRDESTLWSPEVKDSFLQDVQEIAQAKTINPVKDFLNTKIKRYPRDIYHSVEIIKQKYINKVNECYRADKSLIKIDITKTTDAKKQRADKLLKDQRELIISKITKFNGEIEAKKGSRISFVELVDTLEGKKKESLKNIKIKEKTVYEKSDEIRRFIRDNGYSAKVLINGLKEQDIIRME